MKKNILKITIIILIIFTCLNFPFSQANAEPAAWNTYNVGDTDTIYVSNWDDHEYQLTNVTCVYVGPDVYILKDDGFEKYFDPQTYVNISDQVTNVMLPILTDFYGEPSDVDGNGKISIYLGEISGIGGYFSPRDLSGENYNGEIVYINVQYSISFDTLIHEMQHLIYHGFDGDNEDRWFNEGCSVFSESLYHMDLANNTEISGVLSNQIGTSLVFWDYYGDPIENYYNSHNFLLYLYDQLGFTNISAIYTSTDGDGNRLPATDAIMHVVNQYYPDMTFDDLYMNWIVANIAGNTKNQTNRFWYYENFSISEDSITIPQSGLFGLNYPFSELVDIDPFASMVYKFKDFTNPNEIKIAVTIPDEFQNFKYGVGIIKHYRNSTKDPSTYEIETAYLTEENISQGLTRQLNQSADNFKYVWVIVSLLEGSEGGFYSEMPTEYKNVKFNITVTSGDEGISAGTESSETDTEPSPKTTNGLMIFVPLITLNFILFRRCKNK